MLEDEINKFCEQAGVELLVLFGSAAKGAEGRRSDVDLAVKMKKGREMEKLDLLYRLGGMFEDREVDLVVLGPDTDPVLLFEIFSAGRTLYEARRGTVGKERLRALKLYYDTGKLRRLNAEYLRKLGERTRHVA